MKILLLSLLVAVFALGEGPNPSLNFPVIQGSETQTYQGPLVDGERSLFFAVKEGKFGFEIRNDHTTRNPRFVELKRDVRRFFLGQSNGGRYLTVVDTPTGLYSATQEEVGENRWTEWKQINDVRGEKKDLTALAGPTNLLVLYTMDEKLFVASEGQTQRIELPGGIKLKSFRLLKQGNEVFLIVLNGDGQVIHIKGNQSTVVGNLRDVEKFDLNVDSERKVTLFALKGGKVSHAFQEEAGEDKPFTDWRPFGSLQGVTHLKAYHLNRQGVGLLNADGLHIVAIREGEWTHLKTFPRTLTREELAEDQTDRTINRRWITP